MKVKKYDLFYITLENGIGSEQFGRRIVCISQNNIGNLHSPTTIVSIVTSADKANYMPTIVNIGKNFGLTKESNVHCEQIFTIDKSRLQDYVGFISDEDLQNKINKALSISLGLS
ncbi:MAG: type II toxin-antitoxin system PemK/MazF family toxin [Methanobacterium sp.]